MCRQVPQPPPLLQRPRRPDCPTRRRDQVHRGRLNSPAAAASIAASDIPAAAISNGEAPASTAAIRAASATSVKTIRSVVRMTKLLVARSAAAGPQAAGNQRRLSSNCRLSHELSALIQQSEDSDRTTVGMARGARAHVNLPIGDHRRDEFVVTVCGKRAAE